MSQASISENTEKFLVVGIVTNEAFQKCRFIVTKLHNCFPDKYDLPDVRSVLNVAWADYLVKIQRRYGNGVWALKKPVVVFVDNQYLGDDDALIKYLSKKYRFALDKDWYELGKCHLTEHLGKIMLKFRQLVYITVSINHRVIGTMLFELYNDLAPLACENYLTRCKKEVGGYAGAPIHRIVKNSWIQCGGWNLQEKRMPCENYVVPHDRRGVISTCNNGRHKDNSTQFFITLAAAPWMDYNYVAFGQLIQGAEVLKQIEDVPAYYQSPKIPIDIVKTGELVFNPPPDFISEEEYDKLLCMGPTALLDTLIGPRMGTSDSQFSLTKFKMGMYCLRSDMKSYLPIGYMMPEDEPIPDRDYLWYESMRKQAFLNLGLLTDRIPPAPLSPGSSDVTI